MNINDIKNKPAYERKNINFKDYNVSMSDLIEEKWIKNWIDNLQTDPLLREKLLNETAKIRVRYYDNGEIYEMMAHQTENGHLCCMFYKEQADFETIKKLIEA